MSKLSKKLIEQLLDCSSKEKEEIGNTIVRALGGNPQKIASKLPKRKGNQDGGIDGRIVIYSEILVTYSRPNKKELYCDEIKKVKDTAAFNIKIEREKFDRKNLATFIHDMDREQIFSGIIVSASGLSQDADSELNRINEEGKFKLYHFSIADILTGDIICDLEFEDDLQDSMQNSIRNHINS